MTRALDRPFLYPTYQSEQAEDLIWKRTTTRETSNADLTASLVPAGIAQSDVDDHIRQSIKAFVEKGISKGLHQSQNLKGTTESIRGTPRMKRPIDALVSTYKEILCSPNFFYIGVPDAICRTT